MNKGLIHEFGERAAHWKGGRPRCIDCGTQNKCYVSKRCRKCNGHVLSQAKTGKKQPWAKKNLGAGMTGKRHRPDTVLKMSGSNSSSWRGGVTDQNLLLRSKFRQNLQRRIFERDHHTCRLCGLRGVTLHVDHVVPWSENTKLRFDPLNCRTLCVQCHYFITFGRHKPPQIKNWGQRKEG